MRLPYSLLNFPTRRALLIPPPVNSIFLTTYSARSARLARLPLLPFSRNRSTTAPPHPSSSPRQRLLKITNIPAPPPSLGHIRILSLNSPHNRNAISTQLLHELAAEVGWVKGQGDGFAAGLAGEKGDGGETAELEKKKGEAGPTRVLIVASEIDGVFCAGADLKERKRMTREETSTFLTTLRATLTTLSLLPLPTISTVSSKALGGGLELALATTFRVFGSHTLVGLPETSLAIIPGAGGTHRLRALIGEARALELILTGRRLPSHDALLMGICQRCVQVPVGEEGRETVLEAAVELAREICRGGPLAVPAAMRAVREGTEEAEAREYEVVRGTQDRDEALLAFAEKRSPVFRGR